MSTAQLRRQARAEETMMRAVMPRTSAASPEPLVTPVTPAAPRRTFRVPLAYIAKASFTFGDAVRVA